MRWFEGGIPSAIQTAKSSKSVFIVFIAGPGDDAKTQEMETCLHTQEVTQLCEENNCVAVKLDGASNECKFFSQIYPVVVIPSTFFIGDNGVPLEVIGEVKSQQDFQDKVKKAIEIQKSMSSVTSAAPQLGATSLPSQSEPQQTSTVATGDVAGASKTSDGVSVGGATAAAESGSGDESGATRGQEQSLADRVEKAKELVEIKRQEKMRQEAEDARRKEIERRNVGQGVQKLREQQKEMELREAKREMQKDKEEDKRARQKVKEEIERDRAEKALRFNREKDERAQAAEEARKKKLAEQQATLAQEQAQRSNTARIQFRMADGSSLTHQFPATDTFETVHSFITQHVGSEVNLSTSFPRRTFTAEDRSKTLQELQLAPSAAILVIPGSQSGSSVRSSNDSLSLSSLTSLVLSPFFFIWNLLSSLLGMSGSSSSQSQTSQSQGPAAARGAQGTSATGGERDRGSAQKRPAPASSSRQEGAIRRFRNAQDDEDDEDRNTWNGNSTQQM